MVNFAYVDSNGQVMAVTDTPNPPAPTAWETTHGYTRVEVPAGVALSRDVKLTVAGGVATGSTPSENASQPQYTYAQRRVAAYPSNDTFLEAYTEKEIGGDSTKWDAYIIAYNKVRSDNPKPG